MVSYWRIYKWLHWGYVRNRVFMASIGPSCVDLRIVLGIVTIFIIGRNMVVPNGYPIFYFPVTLRLGRPSVDPVRI